MKNIIIFVVDKLAYKHADLLRNKRQLHPTLTRMANQGLYFSQIFSHGCPTMMASPAFYTSTHALDYGGYDQGIIGRPKSFMEILKEKGYKTAIFTAQPITDSHWYGRGVDDFFNLFHIDQYWNQLLFYLRYYDKKRKQKAELDNYQEEMIEVLRSYYQIIGKYALDTLAKKPKWLAPFKLFSQDFQLIYQGLQIHLRELEQNPSLYLDQYLKQILDSSVETFLGVKKFTFYDLFSTAFLKKGHQNNSWFKLNLWERYLPAGQVLELAHRWLLEHVSTPTAVLIHVNDVSGLTFGEGKIQIQWNRRLYKKHRAYYKGHLGRYFYDLALSYVDRELGAFLTKLEETKILQNSHLFITADHGGIPNGPNSPFVTQGEPGGAFKDDYLHVPMIYWHQGIKAAQDNRLRGQIDFAPTLCALVGEKPHSTFQGSSLLAEVTGERVLCFEHTHRGPCDLVNKPIYLGLRNERFKYIWKEFIYAEDKVNSLLEEFYDLWQDPEETKNLIENAEFLMEIRGFRQLAIKRFNEIRKRETDFMFREKT